MIERVARVQFQTEGTPVVAVDAAVLGQLVTNLLMAAASVFGGDPVRERVIVLSVRPERVSRVDAIPAGWLAGWWS